MAAMSGIRQILQDIGTATTGSDRDEWIDLGAGSPARISAVLSEVATMASAAVQNDLDPFCTAYGLSRGSTQLVYQIVSYFHERLGWTIDRSNVVVGPGSQALLFAASTVFTGPRSGQHSRLVLPCLPDYTGYQGLELDPNGVTGVTPRIQLMDNHRYRYIFDSLALARDEYIGAMLLSDPCNPTGDSLTADEFAELVRIAEEKQVPLLVDHAYGSPFPEVAGSRTLPMWHRNVIHFFTFSKFGLPGERLGFAVGPSNLVDSLHAFVANTVLHAPQLLQNELGRALASGRVDQLTTQAISPHYRMKREATEILLLKALADNFNWRLHVSDGGMFCWLWFDEPWFDSQELYEILKSLKVCIVPGHHFFIQDEIAIRGYDHARKCVRISLSKDQVTIDAGVRLLVVALERLRDLHS